MFTDFEDMLRVWFGGCNSYYLNLNAVTFRNRFKWLAGDRSLRSPDVSRTSGVDDGGKTCQLV